jgi:hypothetical protein
MARPGLNKVVENYLYSLEIDVEEDHPQKDWMLEHVWLTMLELKAHLNDFNQEKYVKAKVY